LRLLILGGTRFLGRHLVDLGRARGYQITLFNRGRTEPDLFPDLPQLQGDRQGDVKALTQGRWDAVIDTSGYTPSAVRASAEILSGRAGHYTFISTVSVYQEPLPSGLDESAPVHPPFGDGSEVVGPETYGPLKGAAEAALRQSFDGKALIVRPGLIVGPYDPTDRFTYWPSRLARGGDVLAPGSPDRRVQFIDVRDLANWCLDQSEAGLSGVYNAVGPQHALTMGEMLGTILTAVDGEATLSWIPEDYLLSAGVSPWTDIPLWLPDSLNTLMEISIQAALDQGLSFRSLASTAADTLAWDRTRGASVVNAGGLNPGRELALLEAWHAQNHDA
jgi:2'-hydroxyisoflavone reductase